MDKRVAEAKKKAAEDSAKEAAAKKKDTKMGATRVPEGAKLLAQSPFVLCLKGSPATLWLCGQQPTNKKVPPRTALCVIREPEARVDKGNSGVVFDLSGPPGKTYVFQVENNTVGACRTLKDLVCQFKSLY